MFGRGKKKTDILTITIIFGRIGRKRVDTVRSLRRGRSEKVEKRSERKKKKRRKLQLSPMRTKVW